MKAFITISAIGCAAVGAGLWRAWAGVAALSVSSSDSEIVELCPYLIRIYCQGPFVLLLALCIAPFCFQSGRRLLMLLVVGLLAGAWGLWLSPVFAKVVGRALGNETNAFLLLPALVVAPFCLRSGRRLTILLAVGVLAGVWGLWPATHLAHVGVWGVPPGEGGVLFSAQLQTCWWIGIGAAVVLLALSFMRAFRLPARTGKTHWVRWLLGVGIVYNAVAGVGCWRERHDVRVVQERFRQEELEIRPKLGEIHEGDPLEKLQRLFPEGHADVVDGTGYFRIFLNTRYNEDSSCTYLWWETHSISLVSGKVEAADAHVAAGGRHTDGFSWPSPWHYFARAWYSSDRWQ